MYALLVTTIRHIVLGTIMIMNALLGAIITLGTIIIMHALLGTIIRHA